MIYQRPHPTSPKSQSIQMQCSSTINGWMKLTWIILILPHHARRGREALQWFFQRNHRLENTSNSSKNIVTWLDYELCSSPSILRPTSVLICSLVDSHTLHRRQASYRDLSNSSRRTQPATLYEQTYPNSRVPVSSLVSYLSQAAICWLPLG